MPLVYSIKNNLKDWRATVTWYRCCCIVPVALMYVFYCFMYPFAILIDIITCGHFGDSHITIDDYEANGNQKISRRTALERENTKTKR